MTPEQREEYRKKQRERYATDSEYREKRKKASVENYKNRYKNDPEFRAKQIAYVKEYLKTHPQKKKTVFTEMVKSKYTLAENLLHCLLYASGRKWISTILPWREFSTRQEAYLATVKELSRGVE